MQVENSYRVAHLVVVKKKRDTNQKALRAVEAATGSKPVRGESLLRSPKLKKMYREAKSRIKKKP